MAGQFTQKAEHNAESLAHQNLSEKSSGIENHHDRELFRLAFENANIGMCIVDLLGRLSKVNAEMSNIFGYSIEELEKMNVNDIAHPDFSSVSPQFIRNASDGLVSHTIFEKRYIHKNGNEVICIVTSSSVFDENRNIICFISHVQDVTVRINAEKKLKEQNEELHRLNAEKDKFFSIIAHDLKSPFNSIVGFSELLVQSLAEKKYDEPLEYADMIMKSSRRAMDLLTNLMEWSMSQTGRMKFNPVQFELIDLIEQVELLFSEIARQKSIAIRKKLPAHIPLRADKSMISAVLRNLISNAIKFTKPGGKIHISVTIMQNVLTVSVSDNGIGISDQRISRLFHLDESFSTPGTENETGSGLGLILSKDFVEKHGGTIWVESESGVGTTFKFTIPILNPGERVNS